MKNEENISSNMKARNLRLRESVKNIQRGGSIVLRGVLTIFTISRGGPDHFQGHVEID